MSQRPGWWQAGLGLLLCKAVAESEGEDRHMDISRIWKSWILRPYLYLHFSVSFIWVS